MERMDKINIKVKEFTPPPSVRWSPRRLGLRADGIKAQAKEAWAARQVFEWLFRVGARLRLPLTVYVEFTPHASITVYHEDDEPVGRWSLVCAPSGGERKQDWRRLVALVNKQLKQRGYNAE